MKMRFLNMQAHLKVVLVELVAHLRQENGKNPEAIAAKIEHQRIVHLSAASDAEKDMRLEAEKMEAELNKSSVLR